MTTKSTGEAAENLAANMKAALEGSTVPLILGEGPAENIVEAWRRVLRDMPAVQKEQRGQLAYNFRSIEQFTAHASVLCARHGVIIMPLGVEMEYVEVGRTEKGAITIEARGKFNWRIYGPGGRDDFLDATTFGQGRDSSDKGANKAATAAFKYLLMPSLMISDSKDDPDHERIEASGSVAPQSGGPQWLPEDEERYKALVARVKLLSQRPNGQAIIADLLDKAKAAGFEKFTLWAGEKTHLDAADAAVAAHEEREAAIDAQDAAAEAPQDKPKRTRTKPGSAVSQETQDAVDAVQEAFPGAEEVAE